MLVSIMAEDDETIEAWPAARFQRVSEVPSWSAAAAVVAVSVPVVSLRYGLYDDYKNGLSPLKELVEFDISNGRPVGGVLEAAAFGVTSHIDGFWFGRALCVATLAVIVWALARWLGRDLDSALAGALIAAASCLTVGAQIVAGWGATLFVGPLAALSAGLGASCLWGPASRARRLLGLSGVVAGLACYQPGGMAAVGVITVSAVVCDLEARDTALRLRAALSWLFAAVAAYAVIWMVCTAVVEREGPRGRLTSDVSGKLNWLIDAVIPRVLHPFSLSPGGFVTGFAALVLVAFAAWRPGRSVAATAWALVVVLVGTVGTYLPNLVVEESWASARSMWVLQGLVVVLAGVGLTRLTRLVGAWLPEATLALPLMAVVVLGAHATTNVVDYLAEPNSTELRAVQAAVREAIESNPGAPALVVVAATYNDSIAPGVSADEFGYPASAVDWAIQPMIAPVLAEEGYTGEIVLRHQGDELWDLPYGYVVVDLREVLQSVDRS